MGSVKVQGGSYNITAGDEDELKEMLYHMGPIAVSFQVVSDFRDYKEGIYNSSDCNSTEQDINHAVVAVGFGEDGETKQKYWIIKNSWGESWGDKGYFKIQRGANMCGIAMCNSFPIKVEDSQPTGIQPQIKDRE